ncbi:MAG: hypothetical protein AAF739_15385 [Pseudomonadota bacterium]
MCGICGFALSDAQTILSANLSNGDKQRLAPPKKTDEAPGKGQIWSEKDRQRCRAGVASAIAEVWQKHRQRGVKQTIADPV